MPFSGGFSRQVIIRKFCTRHQMIIPILQNFLIILNPFYLPPYFGRQGVIRKCCIGYQMMIPILFAKFPDNFQSFYLSPYFARQTRGYKEVLYRTFRLNAHHTHTVFINYHPHSEALTC